MPIQFYYVYILCISRFLKLHVSPIAKVEESVRIFFKQRGLMSLVMYCFKYRQSLIGQTSNSMRVIELCLSSTINIDSIVPIFLKRINSTN